MVTANDVIEIVDDIFQVINKYKELEEKTVMLLNNCGPLGKRYIKLSWEDKVVFYGYHIKKYSTLNVFQTLYNNKDTVLENTVKKKKEMIEQIIDTSKSLELISRTIPINKFVYFSDGKTIYLKKFSGDIMYFHSVTKLNNISSLYTIYNDEYTPKYWLEESRNIVYNILKKEKQRLEKQLEILDNIYEIARYWHIVFVDVYKL